MANEEEVPAVDARIEDGAAAEAERGGGRSGPQRAWLRGAVLSGLTLGAAVITQLGGPTTVSGKPF